MQRVFVTGARAKTGRPLAQELAQRDDVIVRGGTNKPSEISMPGVEIVRFSWSDRSTWQAALDAVDGVFVVRPDVPEAPELVRDFVATAGDARVILLSESDPNYFGDGAWSLRVENVVRDSGRPWTILRPGWFMQVFSDPRFFLTPVVDKGVLEFPSDGASVAWIDARDIASVAAQALTEYGHDGSTYELTGPVALSLPAVAALLAETLGRPVSHVDVPLEDALGDSEGFVRENDHGAFDRIRRNLQSRVTEHVQQVTGRRPRTFEDFLAQDEHIMRARLR